MPRRALLTIAVAAAAGCASSTSQPDSPPADVVVIPSPTREQTKSAEDTPPPPPRQQPSESEAKNEDPEEPDITPTPWGSSGPGGVSGGPDCDRAADCCMKILQQAGGAQAASQTCDMIRTAPANACSQLVTTLQSAAQQHGIPCN